jgi:hypothetical protein
MKRPTTDKPAAGIVREMRAEYDFRGGVRGKHVAQLAGGVNIVILDPDVAKVFPDSASVNEALRALLPIIRRRRGASASKRV